MKLLVFYPVTCSRKENHTSWAVAISHIFLSVRRHVSELAHHLVLATHSLRSHHETILTHFRHYSFALPGSLPSVVLLVLIIYWSFYLIFCKTFVITMSMKLSRLSISFQFKDNFEVTCSVLSEKDTSHPYRNSQIISPPPLYPHLD